MADGAQVLNSSMVSNMATMLFWRAGCPRIPGHLRDPMDCGRAQPTGCGPFWWTGPESPWGNRSGKGNSSGQKKRPPAGIWAISRPSSVRTMKEPSGCCSATITRCAPAARKARCVERVDMTRVDLVVLDTALLDHFQHAGPHGGAERIVGVNADLNVVGEDGFYITATVVDHG